MESNSYDLTIIGGGPVGIYGAFYAGMHGLKTKIIDALPQLGGQLAALYPEKYIYDLPGHPQIKAQEMVDMLLQQMKQYEDKIDYVVNQTVQTVQKEDHQRFKICTDTDCHYSRSVIITAGNGAFKPRGLGLEQEELLTNIHYFVTDVNQFKNKRVAVFGGGDSALDWAYMLEDVAQEITVIHRRKEFRAHHSSVERLEKSNANVLTPYTFVDATLATNKVETVRVKNTETDEVKSLDVDEVIVLYGFISSLGPIKEWSLELKQNALCVNRMHETSISGVFAAGDACTYDGKIKMITAGLGEVIIAVNAASTYAYPEKKQVHKHSSTMK